MRIFSISTLLLFIFSTVNAQQTQTDSLLINQITRLDHAHAEAIFHSDAAALDTLMSDDVTVNHPTNKIVKEKAELLSLIMRGEIRYSFFERTPEQFLFYDNLVVVMGHEEVIPAPGAPNAGRKLQRRYSNFWMYNHGRWTLTIRHAHNVCE
jgi:hypothetical protein